MVQALTIARLQVDSPWGKTLRSAWHPAASSTQTSQQGVSGSVGRRIMEVQTRSWGLRMSDTKPQASLPVGLTRAFVGTYAGDAC
eukprot:1181866-Prorocentrum_minimum.AAC.4